MTDYTTVTPGDGFIPSVPVTVHFPKRHPVTASGASGTAHRLYRLAHPLSYEVAPQAAAATPTRVAPVQQYEVPAMADAATGERSFVPNAEPVTADYDGPSAPIVSTTYHAERLAATEPSDYDVSPVDSRADGSARYFVTDGEATYRVSVSRVYGR